MDQEIDLRPYFVAVIRRWRLLLVCMCGLMIIGTATPLIFGRGRSASASVLIVPITSQVTLDPRFQTTNGNQATTPAAQRQALISLASSQTVARQVIEQVSPGSGEGSNDTVERLISQIQVSSSSDLLQITVNDPDPAIALKLANAWGQVYESLVASVYTRSQFRTELLNSEITAAQERYNSAQQSLETSLIDGKAINVQNQITQMNGLLDGSRQEQQMLYTDYLSRTRQLQLILEDAQTLRAQASVLDTNGFADRFAALLLWVRTVDSAAPTLQLSTGDLASNDLPADQTLSDVDRLISVLARRRDQLLAQANEIANAIASDSDAVTGLDATTRQRYIDQLATLNSTYEQQRARQDLLTQQRDLARDTLMLLQRKRDEQEVARSSPQVEVRFVSANLNPKPPQSMRALLSGLTAGIGGLILGLVLVLLLDMVLPALRRLSVLPQGAERTDVAAERPASATKS
jgi:uncharacterized protein involved in exopolysaccharide biosynthesis